MTILVDCSPPPLIIHDLIIQDLSPEIELLIPDFSLSQLGRYRFVSKRRKS